MSHDQQKLFLLFLRERWSGTETGRCQGNKQHTASWIGRTGLIFSAECAEIRSLWRQILARVIPLPLIPSDRRSALYLCRTSSLPRPAASSGLRLLSLLVRSFVLERVHLCSPGVVFERPSPPDSPPLPHVEGQVLTPRSFVALGIPAAAAHFVGKPLVRDAFDVEDLSRAIVQARSQSGPQESSCRALHESSAEISFGLKRMFRPSETPRRMRARLSSQRRHWFSMGPVIPPTSARSDQVSPLGAEKARR